MDEGLARAALGARAPLPRVLRVDVIGALDLPAGCNPVVCVRARREARWTHAHARATNPLWHARLELPCADPSTVLHVGVFDERVSSRALIGQW